MIRLEDKYLDFFLGGNITEPVALEIPLKKVDPNGLTNFLRQYGLDIDTDGTNPGKISITGKTERFYDPYCSIITPALNPSDLKKMFRILETLLNKYIKGGEEIIYPHILDLNNLATQKQPQESASTENALIETLLKEALQSGKAIKIENTGELQQIITQDPEFVPEKYVFSGTAMSDPYTVATTMYARYFRFAAPSTEISVAAHYSGVFGWKKDHVDTNFVNTLPNGRPVGFLHQYAVREDTQQLFFADQGIETRTTTYGSYGDKNPMGGQTETLINRFNNPVVATYVLWGEPNGKVYAFKIPTNDPRWEAFKQCYSANYFEQDLTKRNKINTWLAEGHEHRAYSADEICGTTWKEKLDKEEREQQLQKEKAEQEEQRKKQITAQLSQLYKTIQEIPTRIDFPSFLSGSAHQNNAYYNQYINTNSEIITQHQNNLSKLDEIQRKFESIKSEAPDFASKIDFYIQQLMKQRKEIQTAIQDRQHAIKNTQTKQGNHIAELAESPALILKEPDLDFESKCKILDSVLPYIAYTADDTVKTIATAIFNLYKISSSEEKRKWQDKFEHIKTNASRQVLKQLVQIGKQQNDEAFVAFFKTSLIQKITKILGFTQAAKNLEPQQKPIQNEPKYDRN